MRFSYSEFTLVLLSLEQEDPTYQELKRITPNQPVMMNNLYSNQDISYQSDGSPYNLSLRVSVIFD